MVPPKQSRPSFAAFTAPVAATVAVVDRERYRGLDPGVAARQLMEDYQARRPIKESTKHEKTWEFSRMLKDLKDKGHDLATVTPAVLAEYRAYLQNLVLRREAGDAAGIKENYAYNLVKDWNAMANLLFGEGNKKPGDGLKMKGFRQSAKVVEHLSVDDIERMIQELPNYGFRTEHHRRLCRVYLEGSMCTLGRWNSLGSPELRFSHVNVAEKTLTFVVVKNCEQHTVLLTDRFLDVLADWRQYLIQQGTWQGEQTSIMSGPTGPIPYATIMRWGKGLCALAGIKKNWTTHLPRKSGATIVGVENARFAQAQLGITRDIFEEHYNQPTLAHHEGLRHKLPGGQTAAKSVFEQAGALAFDLKMGRISQGEYDRELARLQVAQAQQPERRTLDPGYQ